MPVIETLTPTYPDGAAQDVPAAQRLLLDIIDTVREPLIVLDAEFRVTQANRAFFHTFRVEPEDTIGEVLFTLGDGQWDIAPLRELLRDKLAVEPQLNDFDVDHEFPGIGRKIMLLNARLVSQGPALPRIILLAIEDITERRFTEWRLAEQHRELQRSNAALDEFASVASHDLQEPVRKILSFGDLLSTSAGAALDGPAKGYLARMLSAAARMRTLISDLLMYSQVTTRVQPFVSTDLARIAKEVVADLETAIAESGGRVEVGELPVIAADPLQMRQLLQNLLGNALKYRRTDTPPVVRLSCASPEGRYRAISVTDNGIGFNEKYAGKIFGMFVRLHGRAEYDGSGIGLAICRKIVERHGGTIAATSTPPPRPGCDVHRHPAGHAGGHRVSVMTQDRNRIPITILICDDDADDRMLTTQALEDAHVSNNLRFVEDGEQLLDYLYQRGEYAGETGKAPRPGLILLDLNMPKMDGREALKLIKGDKTLHDIPIVVLTTSGLDQDVVRSYQLGVNSFITKPVTFSGLVEAMNVLGRYWLQIVELPPVAA